MIDWCILEFTQNHLDKSKHLNTLGINMINLKFGLVYLFNGISIFVGYLMLKPSL